MFINQPNKANYVEFRIKPGKSVAFTTSSSTSSFPENIETNPLQTVQTTKAVLRSYTTYLKPKVFQSVLRLIFHTPTI